jgi:hypothetical protein
VAIVLVLLKGLIMELFHYSSFCMMNFHASLSEYATRLKNVSEMGDILSVFELFS